MKDLQQLMQELPSHIEKKGVEMRLNITKKDDQWRVAYYSNGYGESMGVGASSLEGAIRSMLQILKYQ